MLAYEDVLTEANRLSVDQRIELMDAIWETLPEESLPPLSKEWHTEIQRRSFEIDAGEVKTVPWEQVKAEALRRVGIAVPDAPHGVPRRGPSRIR